MRERLGTQRDNTGKSKVCNPVEMTGMPQRPRVLLVAGARPNFMKIAPIAAELGRRQLECVLVHTGQHYDASMSDTFFSDLGIPPVDYQLGVGSGSHSRQTARVMESFEPVLETTRPDWVVVVGDINSTLACALVVAKVRHQIGCRLAHVEAGLRSGDWAMPEEVNRVLTDRLSDLLLTPSPDAEPNLLAEGISRERIVFVGNVMIDTLRRMLPAARRLNVAESLEIRRPYVVCTLHRPSNVDTAEPLREILSALGALTLDFDVVLPMHPRTRQRVRNFSLEPMLAALKITEPLGYSMMLGLQDGAAAVITDSGGMQEETTVLGVPCVTVRESTERPITITEGTNRLAPWPLAATTLLETVRRAIAERCGSGALRVPEGWDGRASERIVDALFSAGAATHGILPSAATVVSSR
jgi:UDP-N-acetylglucosamine 2-epimerase (non-hydrolysing)